MQERRYGSSTGLCVCPTNGIGVPILGDWVDKIAVWSRRMRRVIRYESGLIARALAEHRYELQQSKAAMQRNLDTYQRAALN